MAWITVDVGERDWSKLAYQFGHELGNVLANSWQPHAKLMVPRQWFEEATVEASSPSGSRPFGRKLEAESIFVGDNEFGKAIEVTGLNPFAQAASLTVLGGYERAPLLALKPWAR